SERFFKSWYTRIISAIDETEEKTLKELLETSAKIDNLCKGNVIWICAYDINKLKPMSLLHLVQAHPYLMLGEEVLENFIFVPQDKVISGTTTEILSLIVDILKRGEYYKSDLKDTLDLYKALFESTGTATVIIEDTTIISVNEAFVSLTGYTREEVENKMTWMEFIPLQEDLEKMLRYRELRLKDPSLAPRSYETRIRDKSGNIIDV
ncbi:PAS domain S-box protein, partial [bacterium]|nr:PAS domain S-box protein [bacterium]